MTVIVVSGSLRPEASPRKTWPPTRSSTRSWATSRIRIPNCGRPSRRSSPGPGTGDTARTIKGGRPRGSLPAPPWLAVRELVRPCDRRSTTRTRASAPRRLICWPPVPPRRRHPSRSSRLDSTIPRRASAPPPPSPSPISAPRRAGPSAPCWRSWPGRMTSASPRMAAAFDEDPDCEGHGREASINAARALAAIGGEAKAKMFRLLMAQLNSLEEQPRYRAIQIITHTNLNIDAEIIRTLSDQRSPRRVKAELLKVLSPSSRPHGYARRIVRNVPRTEVLATVPGLRVLARDGESAVRGEALALLDVIDPPQEEVSAALTPEGPTRRRSSRVQRSRTLFASLRGPRRSRAVERGGGPGRSPGGGEDRRPRAEGDGEDGDGPRSPQ